MHETPSGVWVRYLNLRGGGTDGDGLLQEINALSRHGALGISRTQREIFRSSSA